MKNKIYTLHIFVFLFCICLTTIAQKEPFSLKDINRVINISSLQISPDGKSVIFMTTKKNLEKNNFESSLVLLDIATKSQKAIGQEIQSISAPSWVGNGSDIALITLKEGIRQVHILDLKTNELQQITKSETHVLSYSWSPDGSQLAFSTREKKEWENTFNNSFEVGSNDYLLEAPLNHTSVWLVNANGSNPREITPEGFTIATGLTTSSLSWSSDGKLLTFIRFPSSFSGDSDLGRIYIYNVETEKLSPVTSNKQNEYNPRFCPDNQSIFYQYPKDGFSSNRKDWYKVNLGTGKILNTTNKFDYYPSAMKMLSDDEILCLGINKWGKVIYKIEGEKSSTLPVGDLTYISDWSVAKNGSMVLTALTKDYPEEVYYKSSLEATPICLTHFNTFVKELQLGKQEGIEWKSNGFQPNGILTFPPNFDPNKKYPLVLKIHGGPNLSSFLGFNPFIQAMAARDWIVFEPNYRGSTNLGNEFQAAIANDPSMGPGYDILTGVNVLKEKSYIDKNKIGVSGRSYGGWMTSWLIGRYPKEWTAAVAGATPVDFTDMYSLGDLNRMRRHAIAKSPYIGDNTKWAYENSPISNFSKIRTPTLILSNTGDHRVTITGSYKLYGALRDNNILVQFIAYPASGHQPSDPVASLDFNTRWIEWLEKYLGSEK